MKTFTKIALAIGLVFATSAYADEYIDTLNILKDKGVFIGFGILNFSD